MGGACSTNEIARNTWRLLVEKSEGMRSLGIPRCRRVEYIDRMGWDGEERIGLAWQCQCGNEPSGSIKCWKTIEWVHNWWPLE
jgi:hypothetical protein